jgi:hypothetical protein
MSIFKKAFLNFLYKSLDSLDLLNLMNEVDKVEENGIE